MRGIYYASPTEFVGRLAPSEALPPERVGLQGEYDYYGLAKRVQAQFKERLGRIAAAKVVIKQRGGAIILRGQVDSRDTLEDLVALALATEGTTQVELYDVQVQELQVQELHAAEAPVFQVA